MGLFKINKICIETNGLGELPLVQLRESGLSGICGKNHTGNKHGRIMNCASFADSIKLTDCALLNLPPALISANQLYNERVRAYEYGVKQDDPPDALAGLCGFIGIILDK